MSENIKFLIVFILIIAGLFAGIELKADETYFIGYMLGLSAGFLFGVITEESRRS